MTATPRAIPLNFFSIPFGILGLADCWLGAATFGLAPVAIGRVLTAVAMIVWVVVLVAYADGVRRRGVSLAAQLADNVTGPFASLVLIVPMLAAADVLYPLDHAAGMVVVDVLVVATVLLAGWFTGQWIYRPPPLASLHPGYFLPSVAGGLLAAASAALVGQIGLAQVLFGLGVLCWIVLGSIILGRLMLGPALPAALTPTIAIEVAPAAVASFAAFAINGNRVDTPVRLLAGYGLLMVVAQVRLLPAYRRLPFMPSFWAFTFSWAAVATAGLSWLGISHPSGWRLASCLVLALISAFVGAIAVRTAVALWRGQMLPAAKASVRPAAPASSPVGSPAQA